MDEPLELDSGTEVQFSRLLRCLCIPLILTARINRVIEKCVVLNTKPRMLFKAPIVHGWYQFMRVFCRISYIFRIELGVYLN